MARVGTLFKPEMMRALLRAQNPKRVTRRPHRLGEPGDVIWARESYRFPVQFDAIKPSEVPHGAPVHFESNGAPEPAGQTFWGKLRPSMFMPMWVCRAEFTIVQVVLEPLQDITEAQAVLEGADPLAWTADGADGALIDWPLKEAANPYRNGFAMLWDSINGAGAWASNPWVFAHTFERTR